MDLQFIASKVVEMDRKIKKLQDQFASEKVKLIAAMIEENVSSIEIKRATVTLCQRQNKDFGAEIAAAELELKAEKKKLETLGQFTISSVTNFIQVRWHLGRHNRLPILSPFTPHFTMYPDTMFTFAAAADKLEMTIDEILEILDLTPEDAEQENLSVDEIIEALIDNGLDVWGDDDWSPGCDSCSNYIDA